MVSVAGPDVGVGSSALVKGLKALAHASEDGGPPSWSRLLWQLVPKVSIC